MSDPKPKKRQPLYSAEDRDNILWFWRHYLRKHTFKLCLVLVMILGLGLVMAFPEIALWLPSLYYGN